MNVRFDEICYEKQVLEYPLGRALKEKYGELPWTEIESHNGIPRFRAASNQEFPGLKRKLILGIRKTHKYVENHKVSDYLVPYTSSGCSAMCLYCYLVCNYNKCAYLRVFVNREQMMDKLVKASFKTDTPAVFEIGSNSDLVLENQVTGNLPWTIERFALKGRGKITFPTKFDMVEPLLGLDHMGKVIFRMSINPREIIRRIELGTSLLENRIKALNDMCEAGYPVGMLIAPVIMTENWKELYGDLIDILSEMLSDKVKSTGFIEVIFMTYSFVQNAINQEAFPEAPALYDKELMTGRGKGKYCYKQPLREEGEEFLRCRLEKKLGSMKILYIV